MNEPAHSVALKKWSGLLALPEAEAAREAACWDWYALMRLIQSAHPEQPRIGYSLSPKNESVRLGQPPFFHHPATTIADLKPLKNRDASGPQASLHSYHFGFFGPNGPLPMHLTEFADRHMRKGDAAFVAFCNVLSHRFSSFFFRAWADARKDLTLDRIGSISTAQQPYALQDIAHHGENLWEFFIGCLTGCGLDSKQHDDRVPPHAKLFHAGRFLSPNRNAEGLRAIIEDFFQLNLSTEAEAYPVRGKELTRIIEFQPRTLPIPRSDQWRLGSDPARGLLGFSTILGASVVDYQSGFRIQIGPLHFNQFKGLLPDGERFVQLHHWVRYYSGEDTDPNPEAGLESSWELQLILLGAEVPKLILGDTAQLGYTTWLYSDKPKRDVGDFLARPRRAAASNGRGGANSQNEGLN